MVLNLNIRLFKTDSSCLMLIDTFKTTGKENTLIMRDNKI